MSAANFNNPSDLRLGAKGTLDGRQFTVKGRVVLGAELDGETYYWNEFNLVDESGGALTLVYEETEDGYVWKLFRLYEPLRALSVGEAAARRAGETVNFEGRPMHITLVDQSRVYHIEGVAPEGVEVGDMANYFNADAGDRMLVASWTGDEIEFYEGRDLPVGRVEQAFNLRDKSTMRNDTNFSPTASFGRSRGSGSAFRVFVGGGVMLLLGIFCLYTCGRSQRPTYRPPLQPSRAPALVINLAENMHGALAGRNYTVTGLAQVEIARQGGNFDRREFDLADEAGGHALLVNGLYENREWFLLQPRAVPVGFTPYAAAALKQGSFATIDGRTMRILYVFQSRVLSTGGQPAPMFWPAGLQYGLLARVNDEWFMARWNETEIRFFSGKEVPETEVMAAFTPVEGKAK